MSHHEANKIRKKLIPFMTLLLAVACIGLLASCGGSSAENANNVGQSATSTVKLSALSFGASTGYVGDLVSIDIAYSADNISALLSSKPEKSMAKISKNGSIFTFTPDYDGQYVVEFSDGEGTKKISYRINSKKTYTEKDLILNTGFDKSTGYVRNEYIFHTKLEQSAVIELMKQYQGVFVISIVEGRLVVRVNQDDDKSISDFQELKKNSQLLFDGNLFIVPTPRSKYIPDDGSKFDDNGDNWQLEKIRAPEAWDITRGSTSVLIGVVDSYLFTNHEEIKGVYSDYRNPSSIPSDPKEQKHGTAVSSAIAGSSNNKKGITGVNHFSKISFSSYYNKNTTEDYYRDGCESFDKSSAAKVRVVNHSWGFGESSFDVALGAYRGARTYAKNKEDCLMVAAAGNEYTDAKFGHGAIQYQIENPENQTSASGLKANLNILSNVIVVAAFGVDGKLIDYSNYGESVEIAAPSVYKAAEWVSLGIFDTYFNFGGTSAAAPLVTGVASLLFSKYPTLSPRDVKEILRKH